MIAAYIAMQQWDEEGEADLLRILSLLRQDRGGMIQTKEQYIFLHQVRTQCSDYYYTMHYLLSIMHRSY